MTVIPRALTIAAIDATKIYGQPDPSFGATGSGFAPGEGLNNLGGTLRFATSEPDPLTAPAGTYAITPSGLTSSSYAITYAVGTLTVERATTALTATSVAPVVVGTSSVTLSGTVRSNSVLPVGQAVTVAIIGASGTAATGSGTIGADGSFMAVVDTSGLPVGSYTIRYAYAGDADFAGSGAAGTLAVTYAVTPLYDPMEAKHAGSADPIEISIGDASGDDLSSPGLVVTAVEIADANGDVFAPAAKGGPNRGNVFRETGSSYRYQLDTSGLAAGDIHVVHHRGRRPGEARPHVRRELSRPGRPVPDRRWPGPADECGQVRPTDLRRVGAIHRRGPRPVGCGRPGHLPVGGDHPTGWPAAPSSGQGGPGPPRQVIGGVPGHPVLGVDVEETVVAEGVVA